MLLKLHYTRHSLKPPVCCLSSVTLVDVVLLIRISHGSVVESVDSNLGNRGLNPCERDVWSSLCPAQCLQQLT